jgi:hypothetical protein
LPSSLSPSILLDASNNRHRSPGQLIPEAERIRWATRCHEALQSNRVASVAEFKRVSNCPLSSEALRRYERLIRSTGTLTLHQGGSRSNSISIEFDQQLYRNLQSLAAAGTTITNKLIMDEATKLASVLADGESGDAITRRLGVIASMSWLSKWKKRHNVVCHQEPIDAANNPQAAELLEWAKRCHYALTCKTAATVAQFKRNSNCPIPLDTLNQYMQCIRESGTLPSEVLPKNFEEKLFHAVKARLLTGQRLTRELIRAEAANIISSGNSDLNSSQRLFVISKTLWIEPWKCRFQRPLQALQPTYATARLLDQPTDTLATAATTTNTDDT